MRYVRIAVEEALEGFLRQHEQERPLACDRSQWRWATVDQALVSERLTRPSELHANAPVAADEHLLDRAVDSQVAGCWWRSLRHECTPPRATGVAPSRQEPPKRKRVKGAE